MKITCPHCKRSMSFEDEKLRDYLGDGLQEVEDNQPARQTWIMIIIVAAALAGTVGFGGGALLTRPTRQRTNNEIAAVEATAQKQVADANQKLQQAESRASQLETQIRALKLETATLTKENPEAWATKKRPINTPQTVRQSGGFVDEPVGEVHYEILREFRPYQAPNSLGLDLLVGSNIGKVEVITLIKKLSKDKDPVQINIYTDRKVYEDAKSNIYGETYDEHFLLFYVKNLTVRRAYYGLNEIRWMQEKGKFKDLFGTKTHLQQ